MTDEEYKQLELLLCKLQGEFEGQKYCIVPNYMHDGPYIGLYGEKLELYRELMSHSIKDCVHKFKSSTETLQR